MVRANGFSWARAAPEARTGGNSRWRGAVNFSLRLPALRLPSFYVEAKQKWLWFLPQNSGEARRENEAARVASARLRKSGGIESESRRSRSLLPACGEKDRMRGRWRDSEVTGDVSWAGEAWHRSGSATAPPPPPPPARGEREERASS